MVAAKGRAAKASRATRRRLDTRERLVEAAQRIVARKGIDATTIADITDEADVGIGSFYNHFASKERMIETLVARAIEIHGAGLDRLVSGVSDPAERFSICVRHTIRMADHDPIWAWFTVRAGIYIRELGSGLGVRLLRDLTDGVERGRFSPRELRSALVVIGGAVVASMQGRLLGLPDLPDEALVAENLLRMLGVPPLEAERIGHLPLGDAHDSTLRTGTGGDER
ncbi:HTH-type transcriptional repressor KstR2 [Myxococcaceae bacterium]|jgi:AcrR family transcriptional regulator|nr:HTH-type transcriptional repressor KstR2 [Myxococcaceae bacterium]